MEVFFLHFREALDIASGLRKGVSTLNAARTQISPRLEFQFLKFFRCGEGGVICCNNEIKEFLYELHAHNSHRQILVLLQTPESGFL